MDDLIDTFKSYIYIRVIDNDKNLGLPSSLNKILKTSIARYFVRVDCDDYVSSHFLYVLSKFLESNTGSRRLNLKYDYLAVSCDYFKPIGQTNMVKFSDLQVVNYLENAMIGKEIIMNSAIQSFLSDYLIVD